MQDEQERAESVIRMTLMRTAPSETDKAWATLARTMGRTLTPQHVLDMVPEITRLVGSMHDQYGWHPLHTLYAIATNWSVAYGIAQEIGEMELNGYETARAAFERVERLVRATGEYREAKQAFDTARNEQKFQRYAAQSKPVNTYETDADYARPVRVATGFDGPHVKFD